jgi:protein tyrosine phosphatase
MWDTLLHHGSDTLVSLGPQEQGQAEKFNKGIFLQEGQSRLLSDGTILKYAAKSELTIKKSNGTEGKIILFEYDTIAPDGKKGKVKHYYCPEWLDYDGVDHQMLDSLVQATKTSDRDRPIFVHCSAGIGRTGTFMAAYDIDARVQRNPAAPIPIGAVVTELRHQRAGSVQAPQQLETLRKYTAFKQSKE